MLDEQDFLYVIAGEQSNGRKLNDVWRSSISFNDFNSVQAACGIKIPPCGAGLSCWPNSEGFTISKTRGASCRACEDLTPCVGDDCVGSTGRLESSEGSGLQTAGVLAIIILVALGIAALYFGYRYWQRVGTEKPADGALLSDAEMTSSHKETSDAASEGSNGTYAAPAVSQATA